MIAPVKPSTSRDSCGPSTTTMTPPWPAGENSGPGAPTGTQDQLTGNFLNVKRTNAKRGAAKARAEKVMEDT